MNTETGLEAVAVEPTLPPLDEEASSGEEGRRSGADRRDMERRRSSQGLFEVRARREGIVSDRRRKRRRTIGPPRAWYAFWRKD
jgi:hypothetical protein